jgi:MFS family permease
LSLTTETSSAADPRPDARFHIVDSSIRVSALAAAVWLASLGVFICSLDSALNVAFPAISEAFGVGPSRVTLLTVFYQLPIGILTVLGGLLGDRFGHRHVFSVGVWTTALAFPLCGLAPDFEAFLAARAVQGVGAGLVFGTAPALVTLALSRDGRAPGLGVLNLAAGAGLAVAPLVAGALIDAAPLIAGAFVDVWGWRAVFLFRVPIAVAAGVLTLWPLRVKHPDRWPPSDVPTKISLRLLLYDALAVLANSAFFSIYVFGPYYLVDVARCSAIAAGALFMLVPLWTSLGGLVGGWLTRRVRPASLVVAGLAMETVGLYAVATLNADSGPEAIATAFTLTGCGLGLFQVPNIALVMAALPARSQGLAGGMISAMRTVGIVTTALLAPRLFGARQVGFAAAGAPPTPAFAAAFSDTFLVSSIICLVGAAVALGLRVSTARYPAAERGRQLIGQPSPRGRLVSRA